MLGGVVLAETVGAAVEVVVDVGDVVAVVGAIVVVLASVVTCVVDGVKPGAVVEVTGGRIVVGLTGGRIVVGLTGGRIVVGVTGDTVVVVDVPPPATAITGAMGAAVGAVVVMPEGVTESLG